MTGPEHYIAGDELMAKAMIPPRDRAEHGWLTRDELVAAAQAHYTAALAAATALACVTDSGPTSADRVAWIAAASEHPAQYQRLKDAERAEMNEFTGHHS